MKIYDKNNYILDMAIQAKNGRTEQAFLIKAKLMKEKKIELSSMEEIKGECIFATEEKIRFDKKFLVSMIKYFCQTKEILVLAHTHLDGIYGRKLEFSVYDTEFEKSIIKTAKQLRYSMPIIFIVVNKEYFEMDVYVDSKKVKSVDVEFPYDAVKVDSRNLHIVKNKDNPGGYAYYLPKNRIIKISEEITEKMLKIQKNLKTDTFRYVGKLYMQYIIGKKFENYEEVAFQNRDNFIRSKKVNRLQIIVQTDCNLRCKYCYADGGNYNYGKMKMKLYDVKMYLEKLIIGNINTIEIIMFFGGEPTLNPDVIEGVCLYIEELVKKEQLSKIPNYCMVSNGVDISKRMLKIIKKFNIKMTISIDGPKEINDCLRIFKNGDGTYDLVEKTLNEMKKMGIVPALIEATYTKLHIENNISKEDIRNYFRKKYQIENIMVADCDGNKSLGVENEKIVEEQNLQSDAFEYTNLVSIAQRLGTNGKIYANRCDAGLNNITLMPDGKLLPCHRYLPDKEEKYLIGKFEKNKWDFSMYSKLLANMREESKVNGICQECWAKYLCNRCPYIDVNREEEKKASLCKKYKKQLEITLEKYIFG